MYIINNAIQPLNIYIRTFNTNSRVNGIGMHTDTLAMSADRVLQIHGTRFFRAYLLKTNCSCTQYILLHYVLITFIVIII